MSTNERIRMITFRITVVSLFAVLILGQSELKGVYYYDIALAIFGSSALSYLTAQISYNSDKRKIKRTIISNVLQTQAEVKKILSEYSKTLDYWDENDFYEVSSVLRMLIGEFFSYSKTIKFETGKEITQFIKVENIGEIYRSYINLNGEIHRVGNCLKNNSKEDAYKTYRECIELDKEIVKKIEVLLKKEYGKNFADINSIGLL